uniref:Uncharacterized protein n=1 Tax=Panagrolaimus sp. ES5 TaxID=591445 RepID=A0AC34FXW5_9BILA
MILKIFFTFLCFFSFITATLSTSSECNNFPLKVDIEVKNSWGSHKQVSIILKNTQQRHICSAKLKIIPANDTKIFNKWHMRKSNVTDEYVLPESWILEDLEERRDTGFVLTGTPPKIEPVSIRFCDSDIDEVAECEDDSKHSDVGFSVKLEEKHDWGDKSEITVVFKNLGKKNICYSRFKITKDKNAEILTKWNMKKLKKSGDYILPVWAKLKPGQEFRYTGFILKGPLPTVRRINHKYC